MKPIKSILAEKRDCIAAFRKYPKATHAWCIHHEKLSECISEEYSDSGEPIKGVNQGIAGRINCIVRTKYRGELAARFRNLRPVKPGTKPRTSKRFTLEWPDNTWGLQKTDYRPRRHTIFTV